MSWGQPRRPKISNKLGIPNQREGSDGDTQIRQTNLGAKLFGKIGGRWYSTFLSKEEEIMGTSGTSVGMDSSGALTVDEIKLTGKISLTSSGTRNVCIGTGNNDIGTDNVAIGIEAGGSLISGSESNVYIGNYASNRATNGDDNVSIGLFAGESLTTANQCIAIGYKAGYDGTGSNAGNNCIYIGPNTAPSSQAAEMVVFSSNVAQTGKGANTSFIGTHYVSAGAVYNAKDATAWDQISDVRFKRNIVDVQDSLNSINQIRIRNFNWKEEENLPKVNGRPYSIQDPDILRTGVIGQELEEVFPQCVGEDGHGYKSVQWNDINFLAIKAIQELSAKIDIMQEEINNLKSE